MRVLLMLLIINIIINVQSQLVTYKQNKILSRKKRFLVFPEGSNLQMSISGLKDIMLKVPTGYKTLIECEALFKLPSKTFKSYLKDLSMHARQRREIFEEVSKLFNTFNLNGDACMKKMICEAQYLKEFEENSLFHQLLSTVFIDPLDINETEKDCSNFNSECDTSFLGIILNHIYK